MKLKKLTEEQKEQIAGIVDNEGFWYALSSGGYLKPEDILEDENEVEEVKKAINVVENFERICPEY